MDISDKNASLVTRVLQSLSQGYYDHRHYVTWIIVTTIIWPPALAYHNHYHKVDYDHRQYVTWISVSASVFKMK